MLLLIIKIFLFRYVLLTVVEDGTIHSHFGSKEQIATNIARKQRKTSLEIGKNVIVTRLFRPIWLNMWYWAGAVEIGFGKLWIYKRHYSKPLILVVVQEAKGFDWQSAIGVAMLLLLAQQRLVKNQNSYIIIVRKLVSSSKYKPSWLEKNTWEQLEMEDLPWLKRLAGPDHLPEKAGDISKSKLSYCSWHFLSAHSHEYFYRAWEAESLVAADSSGSDVCVLGMNFHSLSQKSD